MLELIQNSTDLLLLENSTEVLPVTSKVFEAAIRKWNTSIIFFHKPFEAGKYINLTGEMIKDVSANGLCGPGILQILMDTIEGLGLKCSKTRSTSITRI